MARKSGGKLQSSNNEKKKEKLCGSNSDSVALTTHLLEVVLGIEAIDFGLGIGDVITPKSSILQLRQQSEVRHTFNEWLQLLHKNPQGSNPDINGGMLHTPILQQLESDALKDNVALDDKVELDDSIELNNDNEIEVEQHQINKIDDVIEKMNVTKPHHFEHVKIDIKEIEEEINYWNSSLVCYVVSAKLPIQVMEGFLRRIWRKFKVDKVAVVSR